MRDAEELAERVKELACLRGVAALLAARGRSPEATLQAVARNIVSGWRYPHLASVRIRLMGIDVVTPDYVPGTHRMSMPIRVFGSRGGSIEVGYPDGVPAPSRTVFLDTERELLRAICVLLGTMAELRSARESVERQAAEIRFRRAALSRKTIALGEVLQRLEEEKHIRDKRLRASVQTVLLPLVDRLRRPPLSQAAHGRYLDVLRSHLEELAASAGEKGVAGLAPRLSPREVEVADLVRSGTPCKEIGGMLGVSEATVLRHRHNIRRKLGIADPSVNLASFLSGL